MMERRMPASLKNQSVSLKPGVAELADALDSKTNVPHSLKPAHRYSSEYKVYPARRTKKPYTCS